MACVVWGEGLRPRGSYMTVVADCTAVAERKKDSTSLGKTSVKEDFMGLVVSVLYRTFRVASLSGFLTYVISCRPFAVTDVLSYSLKY